MIDGIEFGKTLGSYYQSIEWEKKQEILEWFIQKETGEYTFNCPNIYRGTIDGSNDPFVSISKTEAKVEIEIDYETSFFSFLFIFQLIKKTLFMIKII